MLQERLALAPWFILKMEHGRQVAIQKQYAFEPGSHG
jgi:hypothetical protein